MFIKKIIIENDDIEDSIVDAIISDGKYECVALYDFPELKEGEELEKPLLALCSNNIEITENEIGFYKLKDYYSYIIVGIVNEVENSLVSVGNILIDLNNKIPGDIQNGEKIKFQCDRLDV